MADPEEIDDALRLAEKLGGWSAYAVHHIGVPDTGDRELDRCLVELYLANEAVHRRANQLALRYDLRILND